jgi:hypothetical protein
MKDIDADELQTILNSETEMAKMLQKLNIEGNFDDMLSSDYLKRNSTNAEDMNDLFEDDEMAGQDDFSEAEEMLQRPRLFIWRAKCES